MKRDQRRESRHVEFFRLGQWFNRDQPSFTQDAGGFYVLVDQALDRKDQLIMEGRHRFLWQSPDVQAQGIGATSEAPDQFAAEDGSHTWRETAVRSDRHPSSFRFAGKRQLLTNNRVIAA